MAKVDLNVVPVPAPTKTITERIGKSAIKHTKTAQEAANYVNQHTTYKARARDNFDVTHPTYKSNGDWAGQHPGDNRWVEVMGKKQT